jgi:hypothetical protein
MTGKTMKVGWLIDAELFDDYRDDLVTQIRNQGHVVQLVRAPSPPYLWEDGGCAYRDAFPRGECVIAHGDINLITRIHCERLWTPGAFATVDRFRCSDYYCHFGEFLLNQKYIMLPFGELPRQKEFLFGTVGIEGRIFVRPDSPLKIFTGQVISADTFEADLEYLGFYEFPADSIVIASEPASIDLEWRFVVANGQVITGSQYKRDGNMEVKPDYEAAAMNYATTIASREYQPDRVWVMDICKTNDGSYYLLEVGGFSFCNLYACDKRAIVSEVSRAAALEWEESGRR